MSGSARTRSRNEVRARMQRELDHLETAERPRLLACIGARDGGDVADQAERHAGELELAFVNHRMDQLRTRLAAFEKAPQPSPDGLAVGAMVVIDLGDGPERYLLAEFPDRDLPTITPGSPLGRSLRNMCPGQTVAFQTPVGQSKVTLVAVGDAGEAVA